MIVFRERKSLCRYSVHKDFRGQTCWFSDEKIDFLLTSSGVIFIWIVETSWIHCHVRKLLRKNTLCNQYTVNKRRPVVQLPSRLKTKNSRSPVGWPSQRATHLSNFNESSILLRRVGVAENFERCEDFLKSNSSRTLSRRPVALSGGRADWKVTFRGLRPDAHLHVARISVISTIRRF